MKRFVQFAVFCYFPWWSTAPVTSSAPHNYLLLLKSLENYKQYDKVCAGAAIKAFSNHLWYLTEELVVSGLFSSCVTDETKSKMAEKMRCTEKKICSKRFGPSKYGKPQFPTVIYLIMMLISRISLGRIHGHFLTYSNWTVHSLIFQYVNGLQTLIFKKEKAWLLTVSLLLTMVQRGVSSWHMTS